LAGARGLFWTLLAFGEILPFLPIYGAG